MNVKRLAAALTAGAFMLSSASAYAGEVTRSADALPALKAMTAPVSGVRSSKTLKKRSEAVQGAALGLLILAGAGATAGVIYAVTNKSPG